MSSEFINIPLSSSAFTMVDTDVAAILSQKKIQLKNQGIGPSYACIRENNGVRIYLHRWIMNACDEMQVDHINGDTLDNRRANLRVCTQAENACNSKKRAHSKQVYKGIKAIKGGWYARVVKDHKCFISPTVHDTELAAIIYDAMSWQLHGEFTKPNFLGVSLEFHSDALEYCDFLKAMKGVFWRSDIRKYQVNKQRKGKNNYLGCFETLDQALTVSRVWPKQESGGV